MSNKTLLDNEYILDNLCSKFNKYLKSNIKETEYIIKPKSKTLYIVNRKKIIKNN